MSTQLTGHVRSHVAGADLSAKQFHIVKADTDGDIVVAAAGTDAIVGVLQNNPASGEQAVYMFTGVAKVKAGGSINVNDLVTATTGGAAVATTTNANVVLGRYIGTAAAASGDLIEVQLGIHKAWFA